MKPQNKTPKTDLSAENSGSERDLYRPKEKSLSDKIVRDYWNKEVIKDVKEFIKKLKDMKSNTVGERVMIDWFKERIDKLAGKGLI